MRFQGFLVLTVLGCGGAVESVLFDPPPTKTDATTPPPVDASADVTVPTDSGSNDAGDDARKDVSVITDPGVLCTPPGNTTKKYCEPTKEFCCLGTSSAVCYATGSSSLCNSAYNALIACDDTDDCAPGETCCGYLVNYGYTHYSYVSCTTSCAASTSVPGYRKFCDPNVKDCPTGQTCQASSYLPGYYVCN